MVRVTLEKVSKKFGKTAAVDNVDLKVLDKEFFVLLGPSGGGKSTLLNIIAGLEPQDSGHVYFDELCVDGTPPERRNIAMVFQSYALYPHMNAFENISFALRLSKMKKEEVKGRVDKAASMLGISNLLNRRPHELSGGERQRVALARAIVREPKVFLLDEPMSNIDAKLRVLMRTELIRLQRDLQITMIYVTHDQVEAMTMAQKIAVITSGKVVQVGAPLTIYNHPANLFVAGFIGTPPMNFIDCSMEDLDGKMSLRSGSFEIDLPASVTQVVRERASSSEVILGVRPENITLCDKGTPDSYESEVYAVEPLGSEIIVNLKVGEHLMFAETDQAYPGKIGDKAWFTIDRDRIHVIDKKTSSCIL